MMGVSYRDMYATKFGIPLSARYKHDKELVKAYALEVMHQHPGLYDYEEAEGRALARLDAQVHQRNKAKTFIVTKNHNWRRKVEIGAMWFLILLVILLSAKVMHGQTTVIRGAAAGTTPASNATVTSVDANHKALDVYVQGGGAGGGVVTQPTGTNLHMVCDSGCGGAASYTDASAFTFGTTAVNNISAVVDDVGTNTVAENSAGAVRMNTNRILYVDLSKTAANTNKILVTADPITFASAQAVTQSGNWSVRAQDGAGNALTSNSTTYTAKFGLDGNWLGTLGTAFTTPGFVDIKGADGNVFVRNLTAGNFLSTVTQGTPAAAANRWPVTVSDGTNSMPTMDAAARKGFHAITDGTNTAAVKAASTAAAATDPAVVVAISPNNIVPVKTDQTTHGTTDLVAADITKINGVALLAGAGNTGTGSPRVTQATDQAALPAWGHGATGAAPPAGATMAGVVGSGATGGLLSYNVKCDGYAFYDAATNGATQLVALTSGRTIYVCGYSVTSSSTTANTVKLVYGTGSNCATGQTAMTPGYVLQAPASQGPVGKVVPPDSSGAGLKTASANALCVLTNAAQTAQVEVWYAII